MSKRPPEFRNNKSLSTVNKEINNKTKTCKYCEESCDTTIDDIPMCLDCFREHCEVCHQRKPFITVRRDPKNPLQQDIKQACSDCYSSACNDIIRLDANYGIENIDSKKSNRYDD